VFDLFCAGILVSFGVVLFGTHNLVTGGTAGIAIIGTNVFDIGVGLLIMFRHSSALSTKQTQYSGG
jgi:uncharacterized membrane-anchored protein YitT (DUF2179 family)